MDRREIISFNALRGIAALEVCASHIRAFLFVQYPAVAGATRADQIFYVLTGFGHQAVIVFFVMSGWLVGSSVWQQQSHNRFSWRSYAIARLGRLMVVLIPALVFTLAIDSLGIRLSGGTGYDGTLHAALLSGPTPTTPISLSASTFFGNLVFLQTIAVPVLGINGPLWSLANEFWYYAIFPFLTVRWKTQTWPRTLMFNLVGIVLLILLPMPIRSAFAIWLAGWLGSLVAPHMRTALAWPLCALSLILLMAALAGSKLHYSPALDLALCVPVTLLLIGLTSLPNGSVRIPLLESFFSYLSKISFTLYLFHAPLLALVFFSFHVPQHQPTLMAYGLFALVLIGVLAAATGFWYLFERHTDAVRAFLGKTFGASKQVRLASLGSRQPGARL